MLAIAPLAHADTVPTDNISFAGADTYCTAGSSGCTAGAVTFVIPSSLNPNGSQGNATVSAANGAFAQFGGYMAVQSTTFTSFNYLTPATPFNLFTSTLTNGGTLVFTVSNLTGVVGAGGLTVSGTGMYVFTSSTGQKTIYPSGSFILTTQGGGNGTTTVSFSDTNIATPEPSSLLLLGTGLTLAAGLLFQRRRLGNAHAGASLA